MLSVSVLAFVLASCASDQPTLKPYFPTGMVTDFEQKWYGQHLSAMREPCLNDAKGPSYFALRILYLPTLGRPISLRVEKEGEKITRRSVMLSGNGGYEPGGIKEERFEKLTEIQFAKFLSELEASGFWSLSPRDEVQGSDGSELIIEAIKDGKHVVFDRWTPQHQTEERNLLGVMKFVSQLFQESGLGR